MAEAARDMEYEEFKAKYVAHIEGTAVNERAEVQESDDEGPAPESGNKLKQGSQMALSGRDSSQKG